jgi:hypothetical protein
MGLHQDVEVVPLNLQNSNVAYLWDYIPQKRKNLGHEILFFFLTRLFYLASTIAIRIRRRVVIKTEKDPLAPSQLDFSFHFSGNQRETKRVQINCNRNGIYLFISLHTGMRDR